VKPTIAITIGDFNGIGPEIALKVAVNAGVRKLCTPVLVGPLNIFEHVRGNLKIRTTLQKTAALLPKGNILPVADVGDGIWADLQPGAPTKTSGRTAGTALETAVRMCLEGKANAMVTAPVSKHGLHLAGYNFPGQTEMIALFSRSQKVSMMLVSDTLRVGLVTIHIPLKSVSERIASEKLRDKIVVIHDSLKHDFGISKPRLAVLGLNPHAGESGVLGDEEEQIISPTIKELSGEGLRIEGPFPADGFFGNKTYKQFDCVVAMYHDQGLIPLKMLSFGRAVNFSAGLDIVRTSPDHGTAFDIAGKGVARIDSMVEALKLAVKIAKRRHD